MTAPIAKFLNVSPLSGHMKADLISTYIKLSFLTVIPHKYLFTQTFQSHVAVPAPAHVVVGKFVETDVPEASASQNTLPLPSPQSIVVKESLKMSSP